MPKGAVASGQEADLRIRLLGGFRVSVGARAVSDGEWRLRKAAALLKLLALAPGHRLHREEVLDLLWPEQDAQAANNNLHQALHEVRRVLERYGGGGRESLQLRGGSLTLCPPIPPWIDVEAFENAAARARSGGTIDAYQAAIDLYTGDLLPEDRYEDWAGARRDAVRALYVDLLLTLAELHEARHDHAAAVDTLQRVLEVDGAHEEAHAGLMRLYASTGRRHQALRQYRLLQATLDRELDTVPSVASQLLYQAILDERFPAEATEGAPSVAARQRASANDIPAPPLDRQPRRSSAPPPNNLPPQLTSFVGRQRELAELHGVLRSTRLLTLTGAGGSGKTRLAVQLAADLLEEFPDGVWFVDLANLAEADLVPQAVASALGIPEQPGRPAMETMVATLRGKTALLLLDNCEHLVDACGRLAHELLRGCPRLQLLATSREPLRIAGEASWLVPSLPVPDPEEASLDALLRSEAVQLFVDRVRAVLPGFAATADNAPDLAQVCSKLDGLPLAIELAAARSRALSVRQIAARLDDAIRLLTGGSRSAPTRQQTLVATLDWSHTLLAAPEAALFRRLSVFHGQFNLEAVEATCAGEGIEPAEVLDLLTQLVDKSLVLAAERGEEVRYRLLQPIRQYAWRRLQAAGETAVARLRHRDWCVSLAERAAPELWGADQGRWLDRLAMDHDNLRVALGWSLSEPRGADAGVRLAGSLWPFWLLRGHLAEGRRWLEESSAQAREPSAPLASALLGVYALAIRQGDPASAQAAAEASLAVYRDLNEQRGASRALHNLAVVDWLQGDYQDARKRFGESQRLAQEADDDLGRAAVTHSLGVLTWSAGDLGQAESLFRESIAVLEAGDVGPGFPAPLLNHGWLERRGAGGQGRVVIEETLVVFREVSAASLIGQALANLGNLARANGDLDGAWGLLEKSLALFRRAGDRLGTGLALAQLGNLAAWAGDGGRAQTFLDQSLAVRREVGDRRGVGMTLVNLGRLGAACGDTARARDLLEQGLSLFRKIGDKPGIAISSGELGILASTEGDTERARLLLEESFDVFGDLGVKLAMALCLRDLGLLATGQGDYPTARRHLEASLALFQRLGDRRHAALIRDDLVRLAPFSAPAPSGTAPA